MRITNILKVIDAMKMSERHGKVGKCNHPILGIELYNKLPYNKIPLPFFQNSPIQTRVSTR